MSSVLAGGLGPLRGGWIETCKYLGFIMLSVWFQNNARSESCPCTNCKDCWELLIKIIFFSCVFVEYFFQVRFEMAPALVVKEVVNNEPKEDNFPQACIVFVWFVCVYNSVSILWVGQMLGIFVLIMYWCDTNTATAILAWARPVHTYDTMVSCIREAADMHLMYQQQWI